jgi:hypothetical protein
MSKKSGKKGVESHLPKHPPKKTGKRGIGAPPDGDEPEKLKKPRQARLPSMEDPKIEELEAAAEDYAAIRDERMALTPREKKLKDDLLAAMKRHGKEKYHRDGIEIRIVHESETVKVRVKKGDESEE